MSVKHPRNTRETPVNPCGILVAGRVVRRHDPCARAHSCRVLTDHGYTAVHGRTTRLSASTDSVRSLSISFMMINIIEVPGGTRLRENQSSTLSATSTSSSPSSAFRAFTYRVRLVDGLQALQAFCTDAPWAAAVNSITMPPSSTPLTFALFGAPCPEGDGKDERSAPVD
jgi:hypothetical protein